MFSQDVKMSRTFDVQEGQDTPHWLRSNLDIDLGIACAVGNGYTPGAAGFWGIMMGEGDVQRVVPAARWDMDTVYSPDILPGKMSINIRYASRHL